MDIYMVGFNLSRRILSSWFILIFFVFASFSACAKNFDIYISPDGFDSYNGGRPDSAVKSLVRVKSIFEASTDIKSGDAVNVLFMPGKYYGLSVVWNVFKAGVAINFRPYRDGDVVVIDGEGGDGKFFSLNLKSSPLVSGRVKTGIYFKRIHLLNYCEGISFGDWNSDVVVTDNKIEGVIFENIGSKYDPLTKTVNGVSMKNGSCVAAVRLQRAQKNVLLKNKFVNIENLLQKKTVVGKYGPYLMHAIYIADDSSDNIIRGNKFQNFTGSPIRIRNRSDRTRIFDNSFENPVYVSSPNEGYSMKAVSQWYCNEAVGDCIHKDPECPSLGTVLNGNLIGKGLELYADESQSKKSTCPLDKIKLRNIETPEEVEFK